MSKMLAVLAAIVMLWMIALPGLADATQRWANGVRDADQHELRAQRRCVRMAPHTYRSFCYYYYPDHYRPYAYGPYYRPLFFWPFWGW